jgi:hypothetical protein
MFHMRVFCTLFTTGKADIGANATNIAGVISIHAHYLCSGITNGGAFHIKLYAAGHFGHIFFLQAGGSTMVTNSCAPAAGINTGLVHLIVSHNLFFRGLKHMEPQRMNHHSNCGLHSNCILICQILCPQS